MREIPFPAALCILPDNKKGTRSHLILSQGIDDIAFLGGTSEILITMND